MSAVAKEVKKALLEEEKIYSSYHEAELDAIHFNELPSKFKTIKDDEEYVLAENMSREELINFVANIDWSILARQYKKFYPNAYSYYENYIYDSDTEMSGGTIYVQVPCSDITINVDFDVTWDYVPYRPGDYYQPPEGGYGEVDTITTTGVEIDVNKNHIKLTKEEIVNNKLDDCFSDEISEIVDNNYDEEYFNEDDDDAYDRWKDEQWERGED